MPSSAQCSNPTERALRPALLPTRRVARPSDRPSMTIFQCLGHIRRTPHPTRDNEVTMEVTLELPEELARLLGENAGGLRRAALEALTLEGLRSGKLTVSQARRLLGIASRYEMDGFLK